MKKKKIYYSQPYLNNSDYSSLKKIFKSKFLTQGPEIQKFENKVSNFVNVKYSVGFNSATSALHAACYSLGFKQFDILWTVPNTFVASANCGRYLGGQVDFVDIENETKNIDIKKLENKLESCSKKLLPKILVTVDFGGNPVKQDKIFKLSKKFKFKIIEDASHAFGARYKKNMIGNCKWSDITVFSFHPVKTITTIEGGVATTNKFEIYQKLKMFRTHGITRDKSKIVNLEGKKKDWYYEQKFLGYNYRMSDVSAALGINQLKKIKKIIYLRNKIAKVYDKRLKNLPLKLPQVTENSLSTYHLYPIQLTTKDKKEKQLKLYKFLKARGILTNVHYLPVHLHPYYKQLGFKKKQFPVAEHHANSSLSLPIYPDLKLKDQIRIIDLLKKFFIKNLN